MKSSRASSLLVIALTLSVASASVFSADGDPQGGVPSAMPSATLVSQAKERWAKQGFTTRFVRVNGVELHVAEAGRGDLVVLLHGYPQSGEVWRLVGTELAKHHHVVVPDLRGMGLSQITKGGYDLATVSEDVHQLTRVLGYQTVKVAGHDWGGAVAAVFALRYRSEVTKLGFLESALAGGGFEDLWTFSKPNDGFTFIPFLLMGASDPDHDVTAELISGHESSYLKHLWTGFTADKQAAPFENWVPYIDAMKRPGLATSSSAYYRSAYRSADQVRALDESKLSIPVLSLAGEKGIGVRQAPFVDAFASNVVDRVVISGAGHFLAEERPVEVAAALDAFFSN